MVCERRTLALALQQISEIAALRIERDKVELRKRYGLKEGSNPMLSVRVYADLFRLGSLIKILSSTYMFLCMKGAYQWKCCTQLFLVDANMCLTT